MFQPTLPKSPLIFFNSTFQITNLFTIIFSPGPYVLKIIVHSWYLLLFNCIFLTVVFPLFFLPFSRLAYPDQTRRDDDAPTTDYMINAYADFLIFATAATHPTFLAICQSPMPDIITAHLPQVPTSTHVSWDLDLGLLAFGIVAIYPPFTII